MASEVASFFASLMEIWMRVKLKVAKGASAGKVFEVKVPQFIIGRSSGCQLRPQSDAISRKHCVIMVGEDSATIRDLKSRNGTIVNGDKIRGEHTLVCGDEIRVGPLHLEVVVLDNKGAKVEASRKDEAHADKPRVVTARGLGKADAENITDWLMDDEDDGNTTKAESRMETRQFKIDETEIIDVKKTVKEQAGEEGDSDKKKKKEKKEYGKLPTKKEDLGKDSKEAAEAALFKMMRRGL